MKRMQHAKKAEFLTVKIEKELKKQLKILALNKDISLNVLINQMIKRELKQSEISEFKTL